MVVRTRPFAYKFGCRRNCLPNWACRRSCSRPSSQMGYEEATHIQSQAIPALLSGADVVGQSQTGSGKTAAFALPAIEKVDVRVRAPQVLILCPTRELAVQVAEEVAKLASLQERRARNSDLRRPILRPPVARPAGRRANHHRHAGPHHGPPRPPHLEAGPGARWSSSTRPTACSTWAFSTTSGRC